MLATKEMSKTSQPTLPFVLPTYYKLQQHLESVMRNRSNSVSIRSAAANGKDKLEKYMAFANENQHYTIATGAF